MFLLHCPRIASWFEPIVVHFFKLSPMKKAILSLRNFGLFVPALLLAISVGGCNNSGSGADSKKGTCEKRITAGKVDCDGTKCTGTCVLQSRKKGSTDKKE